MAALELLAGAARASRESNGLSVRKRQGAFGFLCSQSTEPTAPEEALVCFVLFNGGRFSLFRCVVMMFGLLRRSSLRDLWMAPRAFLAAIGWADGPHMCGKHTDPGGRVS